MHMEYNQYQYRFFIIYTKEKNWLGRASVTGRNKLILNPTYAPIYIVTKLNVLNVYQSNLFYGCFFVRY